MIEDCLKLTAYFGERDRTADAFLADALLDAFAARRIAASVLLRGVRGFGGGHHVRSDRLLTLSEDLPLVAVAVDRREAIEELVPTVRSLVADGLVTLERARMLDRGLTAATLPEDLHEATKLTLYVGRTQRPGHVAIVDALRRHGVAGASVLLGVDGTVRGSRRRARFFASNAEVPLMIISVGDGRAITAAMAELASLLHEPVATLERVRVCKRDGRLLASPAELPATGASGPAVWQKLMVYAGEQSRHAHRPLHELLIGRLLEAGAMGATSLRGIWGYHGDHEPHGDRFFALRRHVPMLTLTVDTPERTSRWFHIVDELTDETGVVTSEIVPTAHGGG